MTHPAVLECAVTAAPDEIRGQIVKASIVLNKDYKEKASQALAKELQEHVKHETAPYKYPRIIEFVDELPKTISGKVQRSVIRKENTTK
jgi:acetyl-CoA synthetase